MLSRYILFFVFIIVSSLGATAQPNVSSMSSDAWMKMITDNAANRTLDKNGYQPVRKGFALYYSHVGNLNVPYLVYVPASYDPERATSMVVFLHGAILARDSFRHKDPSIADEPIFEIADTFKTIVVFPFSKSDFAWPAQQLACENIISIIGQVQMHYNIDSKKIYLGGISMGGIATFWFINKKADLFAGFYTFSAMPPANTEYRHITEAHPLWSAHAEDDQTFPYSEVLAVYEQHKKEAPGWHFRSTPTGGHRFLYHHSYLYLTFLLGNLMGKK